MPPMPHQSRDFRRRLNRWCHRTSTFMEWTKPNASVLIDSVSGTPLSHITLLCKHLMHGEFSCHKCDDMLSDVRIYQALTANHSPDFIPSGSFAEDCPLFPFFVGNKLKGTYEIKRSDFDFMFHDNNEPFPVGFDPRNEPNIRAVIETSKTQPGYLRLRNLESNNYINDDDLKTRYCIKQANGLLEEIKLIRRILQHRNPNLYSGCQDNCDFVFYFPCEVWPPQAKFWITRKRHSNWPTEEIIQETVKTGCAVVSKAHPSCPPSLKKKEFRFSFSFAEKILFGKLSLQQRKCFVAFKTIMKFTTHKLEILQNSETKLKTYHLKTVFLWACETIEAQEWETSQGWANCLLYLIDQLIICLNKMTLPSYFIPENDLFDGVRTSDLIDELADEIKRVRQNPLRTAAEMLDSIASASHFYSSPTSSVEPLSVSCFTASCAELLLPNIGRRNSPQSADSDNDKEFKFLLSILVSLQSTGFNGDSCTILVPIASWYMTNKEQLPLEGTILHSLLFLKDGSEIRVLFKIIVNILRKFHTSEFSIILQQIFKMLVQQADTLHWLFFSALVLMQANDYDAAREVLLTHIKNDPKWKYCSTINISQIMSEMNYREIFNNKTMNIIREHDNSYKFVDLFVSSEVLLNFLLSKCFKTLAMETSLHLQLERIKKLVEKNSKLLLDHLLADEVAHMCRNSTTLSEMNEGTLILIRNRLQDHILSKRKKQKGFQRAWKQICTDYLRPIHSVINCKIDELNGDKSSEMFRRVLFALMRKLGKLLHYNYTKSELNNLCTGIQKILEDIDIFKPNQSNIEKYIHVSFNPKRDTRLYEFLTFEPNPNVPSFKKLMLDAMAYAGYEVSTPGTEVNFSREEFNRRMSSLVNLQYLFDDKTPALRNVYTSEMSVIEMYRKFATNMSLEIFLRFIAGCIEMILAFNVVDLSRVCVSDNDNSWFANLMHTLDVEPAAFHCSLEPYLPCNAALKDVLHFLARKNLPDGDFIMYLLEGLHLNSFVGHMLLSNDRKTIADRIYICQMQIFAHQFEDAIPILEQVISLESANPTSTVIWPEELGVLVDDNVRSEIGKSRGDCIIVPSVVYALYLLAGIHGSLHNKEAYQQTMETFERVCEYLGESSVVSKRLLEYARDLDENGVIRQNGGGGCTQATKIEGGYKRKRKRRGSGNTAPRKRKRNN